MTFHLTEEQAMIQKLARDFATAKVAPLADELSKTGRFPEETIREMAEIGFMGINIPEEYGGAGMDEISKSLVITEIAKACASTAEILAVHILVSDIILRHGTEEQKQKYLPMACSGKIGAFALTEPGAGSDAATLKTKARSDGDDYVIDGTKCFISNMGPDEGDYVVVIALTDPDKGVKGMSAILVDRDTPGFTLGKTEEKMGLASAAVSELIFENCRVPKTNRLWDEGKGFHIAMAGLDGGRIGIASQALGVAEAALDAAISYSKQRVQFGKPISALEGIQWYIADMGTRVEAARGLVYRAADARQNGDADTGKLASMAKYYASETAVWVSSKALQIHGGYGYMKDYAIERIFRDARIIPLYEGTSEIQKVVISKALLK